MEICTFFMCYFMTGYATKNFTLKYTTIGTIGIGFAMFLPIISGLVLFCALCKIGSSLKTRNDAKVNIKAMIYHATSFGIYMVSSILALAH